MKFCNFLLLEMKVWKWEWSAQSLVLNSEVWLDSSADSDSDRAHTAQR